MRLFFAAMLLVGWAWPVAASAQEVDTRRFEGHGSRGVETDIEFFLVAGTYQHTLESNCRITAGIFPSLQQPAVLLSEVLDADLATLGSSDEGQFPITQQGWANLQLGTGPDCTWEYTVTGAFLPLGDEPDPPGPGFIGWWPLALVVAGAALIIGNSARRRPVEEEDEPRVRVTQPPE